MLLCTSSAGAQNLNRAVNDYKDGFQLGGNAAVDPTGGFMIVWDSGPNTSSLLGGGPSQDGVGNHYGVYAKRYDTNGDEKPAPADQGLGVGNEFQVHTTLPGDQAQGDVGVAADGSFVISWTDFGGLDGDCHGVFLQRFDSNANKVGEETPVNTVTAGCQRAPDLAVAPDGTTLVTWTDFSENDGSGTGIFAQLLDPNGTRIGASFIVNSNTVGDQTNFEEADPIGVGANGFIIVWTDHTGLDGDGRGVFGKRYDKTGTELGRFQVNSSTTGDQESAHVAVAPNGRFVVVWSDRASNDAHGQRYDRDGNRLGGEFTVNVHLPGLQVRPVVALDDDGYLLVAWQSNGQASTFQDSFAILKDPSGTNLCGDGSALPCPIDERIETGLGGEYRTHLATAGSQVPLGALLLPGLQTVVSFNDQSERDEEGFGVRIQETPTFTTADPVMDHLDDCPDAVNPAQE